MTTTFAQLGLPEELISGLARRNILQPFPIQAATIADALAGRDITGKAPTGSGKTLAFGLPMLARVSRSNRNQPHGLVLAPTRELAEQILQELSPLAKAVGRNMTAIYGGVGYGPQKNALRQGVDVVVATPGRLEDLIAQRAVDLSRVEIVVLDEADRMADMGFLPAVRRILDQTSANRQTLLFSATLDGVVGSLSRSYQTDPARHEAQQTQESAVDADHHFWLVDRDARVHHTADVIRSHGRSIVFTKTRHGADRLAKQLDREGLRTEVLHGGRSQNQRTKALKAFSAGRVDALIATDVAARGIHIEAVAAVVHFDPAADTTDYLHRSGRTARAGATGTVVSLVTGDQQKTIRRMQKDLGLEGSFIRPQGGAGENRAPAARMEPAAPTAAVRQVEGADSIYVANLPWELTADQLEEMFGDHGAVHQVTIITDRRTGRSKGFGFVDMNPEDARGAVAALHGMRIEGRDLTVRVARPRTFGA